MPTLLCLRRLENELRLVRRLKPDLDDAERLKFGCDGDTFGGALTGEPFFFKVPSLRSLKVVFEAERRRLRAEKDLVRTPAEMPLLLCKTNAAL